jgi:hypothetical protein
LRIGSKPLGIRPSSLARNPRWDYLSDLLTGIFVILLLAGSVAFIVFVAFNFHKLNDIDFNVKEGTSAYFEDSTSLRIEDR